MIRKLAAAALSLGMIGTTLPTPLLADDEQDHHSRIKHVLLVSIDGMHAVDFINCARGIEGVNNHQPYCPNLKELGETGINYLDTSTSKPSDSFPGLTALVTGGSPRTTGVYYDVSYDRVYAPPAKTTGNGLSMGDCFQGHANGTSAEYEEGIDINQGFVNGIDGVSTVNGDGGINSIDPNNLIRDPLHGCKPVYPWNFLRVNTIFGVAHSEGMYTAWADKHPAYASVSGPGDGTNVNDFYGPEINSNVTALPVTTVDGINCTTGLDFSSDTSSWTNSFVNIKCYDTLKVNAVLNEIDGYNHNRSKKTKVPAIFGMNFQAVSVGQKLIQQDPNTGAVIATGGYSDAQGTPSGVLLNEIRFVDAAIGQWVNELRKNDLLDSTLIVISAKHGQSPIDSQRYTRITKTGAVTTSPSRLVDTCLPDSESNAGNQIGPTEDDISLLWLKPGCDAASEVQVLESQSPASANIAGIGQIFWGRSLLTFLNAPGIPPFGDSRTPDIIVTPNVGVTYSKSTAKQAEHGGFAHDDTNVMMLLSNPSFARHTVTSPVETTQVAPTILLPLGLDPRALAAVRAEGTQALPAVQFGNGNENENE